ncbi:hypothetical protein A2U01_0081487, partial [Trifolium medium]|nr:hypothetical protein [Trifolium medium]
PFSRPEPQILGVVAERAAWSLSELVASARQGSPMTLKFSDVGRQMFAERGLAMA